MATQRYVIFDEIAAGGMGSVYLGKLFGDAGFQRTVAIKKLHPHLAKDPQFVAMFVDEARLASRVLHPNVCGTLDVVNERGELMLVLDYVHGEPLARLLRVMEDKGELVPIAIAVGLAVGVLEGLHAAHVAKSVDGSSLDIVHRDVSPQNVMLGPDGVPRVVDFGIAKAAHRVQTTRDGALKGKVSYMAPEQLRAQGVDRRADIYAAGVVLWELLANEPFVPREAAAAFVAALERVHKPPSQYRADVPRALDDVVMRALARTPSQRFNTAREMADALELAVAPASARRIGEWATHIAGAAFEQSAARVSRVEAGASSTSGVAVSNAPNIEDLSTAVPAPVIDRAGARTEEHAPLDRLASVTDYQAHLTPASGHTRRGALLGFGVVLAVATAWLFWGGAAAKPAAPLSTVPPAAPTSEVAQAFPITAAPTWSSPATASGDSPAAPRASVPLRARAPSPPSTPCKPPYTESNGVRRYKPECL